MQRDDEKPKSSAEATIGVEVQREVAGIGNGAIYVVLRLHRPLTIPPGVEDVAPVFHEDVVGRRDGGQEGDGHGRKGNQIVLVGLQREAVVDEQVGVGEVAIRVEDFSARLDPCHADQFTHVVLLCLLWRRLYPDALRPFPIVLADVEGAALGADPHFGAEVDVVVVAVVEDIGERDEGESMPLIALERAGGDDGIGEEELPEARR